VTAPTDFERALAGYDPDHTTTLANAICKAIAEASLIPGEPPILALRTGEAADALMLALVQVMAMSPTTQSPTKLREFAENIRKRIIRDVPRAQSDPDVVNFVTKNFSGFHSHEGHA
jgi:hypothetical protein